MSVYIFTGPTLSVEDARGEIDAIFLPPVAQGDISRLMRQRPHAIGIIDGYFDAVPAVWHKELLWAMSQGVHVFGSASMGALRAAELHAFGMVGTGRIFEAYVSGELEDDDEVAVAHASDEFGFRLTSEAMVNIRYTLQAAEEHNVISAETRQSIEGIAKQLFYPDRAYSVVLDRAGRAGVSAAEIRALRSWITTRAINQKRSDALCMCREMRQLLAIGMPPKETKYVFQHTSMWETASRTAGTFRTDYAGHLQMEMPSTILNELRLSDSLYHQVKRSALTRFLAILESRRAAMPEGWQQCRNRANTADGSASLSFDADVSKPEVEELLDQERRMQWLETRLGFAIEPYILDELRVRRKYGPIRDRALAKHEYLRSVGLDNPDLNDTGLDENQIWNWFFENALQKPTPSDIEPYSRTMQFADMSAFRRAVVSEYLYVNQTALRKAIQK